ncbi:hypothetical protein V1506DRAFT_509586 [Lipomyces tetrasporus]
MSDVGVYRMECLRDVKGGDDNWTGLTDPKERRRRQNRVHQRAWRRKCSLYILFMRRELNISFHAPQRTSVSSPAAVGKRRAARNGTNTSSSSGGELTIIHFIPNSTQQETGPPPVIDTATTSRNASGKAVALRQHSSRNEGDSYLSSSTASFVSSYQPPSSRYNVLRAIITNIHILRLGNIFPAECGAALNISALPSPHSSTIPSAFTPTAVQNLVPHEVWMDTVPFPQMRDNLILNIGKYDADDLCVDILGGLYEGYDDIWLRGILVWSNPWSEEGWEVTEGFLNKWNFLLRGCETLMRSTNRWRRARGEDELVFAL